MGFHSMEIDTVFGVHDYEQFYRDIYRKAFVHANKHQIWLPRLVSRWKKFANNDDDYQIALRGLYDGLISLADIKIDTRDYGKAAENAMRELGFQEKPALTVKEIDFKQIEAILSDSGDFPSSQNHKSLDARLARLKSRYDRLGILRIAPYLFGAMLCDIGVKIKRLVEKGR